MRWDSELGDSLFGLLSSQDPHLPILLEDKQPEAEVDSASVDLLCAIYQYFCITFYTKQVDATGTICSDFSIHYHMYNHTV